MPGSPVPTKCSGYTKEPQSDSSSSSAANRKTSFQRTVKSNFCTYLRETTVHGVRYVAEGKNFFERLFWIGFITAGFISSGYMLTQSMNESYYNPILTTIDTTSVKNVPFPAVTVDAGRILNPWGYVEKIGDLVQMDCYTDKTLCPATERVKTDFKDLFEGVVEVMTDSFVKGEFEGKSLDQLEEIQKGMSFAKSYGGFRRDAASMAFIIQGNPKSDSIRYTKKELKIATAATFGKYSPSHNPVFEELGNKYVRPIFDGLRAFNNISDEDIVPCLQGEEDCQEALVEAYKILLPIFR